MRTAEAKELWRYLRTPIAAYKLDNETVNNSTALQNDDHLYLVLPAGRYAITLGQARFTSSTAADFKWDFTFSGTATIYGLCFVQNAASSTNTTREITAFSSSVNFGATTGTTHILSMLGGVDVVVGGTLQFRWAQNTLEVSDTIVLAEATLKAFPTR